MQTETSPLLAPNASVPRRNSYDCRDIVTVGAKRLRLWKHCYNCMATNGHPFEDVTASYYPLGIAGKVAGKSSNTQWAFPTAPDEIWRGPSPTRPQQCVHNGWRCRHTLVSSVLQRFHYRVPAFASLGVGLKFRRARRGSPQVLQVYFAAMWYRLDVAAPGDCSSAIKPKVSAVCPSAVTWASGASPSRCSSSISATLFSRFLSWSRRRLFTESWHERGQVISQQPQRVSWLRVSE